MEESGYYPAGAYNDPNAPYNQRDPEEKQFVIEASYRLFKDEVVHTIDYIDNSCVEYDDDGGRFYAEDYDYIGDAQTDYEAEYLTPCQMLAEYKMMLTERIVDVFLNSNDRRSRKTCRLVRDLQARIKSANCWEEEWC